MANEKRLIDANKIQFEPYIDPLHSYPIMNKILFVGRSSGKTIAMVQEILKKTIDNQPTVDAVEVVHGHWIKYTDEKFIGYDEGGRIKYRKVYSYNCEKCGHGTAVKSNYCPACGAKMEGEKEVGY